MLPEGGYRSDLTSLIPKLIFYTGIIYAIGYVLTAAAFILLTISISSAVAYGVQVVLAAVFSLIQIILIILFILRGTRITINLAKGREVPVKAVVVQGILIGIPLLMGAVSYFAVIKAFEKMISELGIFSPVAGALAGGFLSYAPVIMLVIGSILLMLGAALLGIPKPEMRILGSIILLVAVIMVYFLGILDSPICKLSSALCQLSSLGIPVCIPCSGPLLSEVLLEGISALLVTSMGLLYAFLGRKILQIYKIIAIISAFIFGIGLIYFGFSAGNAFLYLLDLLNKLFAGMVRSSSQLSGIYASFSVLIAGLFIIGIAGILVLAISAVSLIPIVRSFIPSVGGESEHGEARQP